MAHSKTSAMRPELPRSRAARWACAFADYDDDGFTDIFVSNDGMRQFFFHNNGNGTFTECALEAGAALTGDGKPLSGMGTVFQDYDNDGRPDILVTVLPREIYALFHNDGNGTFSYRSLQAGLGLLSAASSGWGVGLEDFDNDGWKDLFVAQSHVLDNVEADRSHAALQRAAAAGAESQRALRASGFRSHRADCRPRDGLRRYE